MDIVVKAAAAAMLGTLACLLIKRSNAEMTAALALTVCAVILLSACALIKPLREVTDKAMALSGLSGAVFSPVLKCVAIGIISKISADMCRDGGQGAIAGTVELTGTICAVFVSLPLLNTLLDMLGELL